MSNIITRRSFFKFLTLSAGTTLLAQSSDKKLNSIQASKTELLQKTINKNEW